MKQKIAKIVLLGDGAVGKTSIITRFVHDQFSDEYIQTIGTKVTKKEVDLPDVKIRFLIWDILGQIKEHRLHGAYYAGALGGLIVADFTRRETLDSVSQWVEGYRAHTRKGSLILLCNKEDLPDKAFTLEEAQDVFDGEVMPTSALTGLNVDKAFETLAKKIADGVSQ